ncbi:MAG: cysteine--tRNA ligase, partial [Desulfobacterales bacterium]
PFFNFWMHGAFLIIQGGKKMAKSEGNFLTLENAFLENDINPLVYRFASFLTHYRKPMEYSDEGILAARNGLLHLQNQVRQIAAAGVEAEASVHTEFKSKFTATINDDLNMPRAMAVIQEMLKSKISDSQKYSTMMDFDQVLGLRLDQLDQDRTLPEAVQRLVTARQQARKDKDFATSDQLRAEIEALGYQVQDTPDGMNVVKK